MFAYEKWRVYQLALDLRNSVTVLDAARVPGTASDFDHLRRGASSVVFNIGEGALHWQKGKKLQFYRTALGSVGECNAALVVLSPTQPDRRLIEHARDRCDHIAALLTNLIASVERRPE